jgi:uncharacterized protein
MTDGVTVAVTRRLRDGCDAAYEAWVHEAARVAGAFPGHLGVISLRQPGSRDATLVFRFDSQAHLEDWDRSAQRTELVARAEALSERTARVDRTGLEAWFSLPEFDHLPAPPRWKMMLCSWATAFPILQVLDRTLGRYVLASLPGLLRGALVGLSMIAVLTYVAMPFVTRQLAGWLYRRPRT